MRPTNNQKKILFVVSCRLSKLNHWTIHQQEFTHRMLPHLHQNIIPQWKHQIQSSKEKTVIIKIKGGQVSIEKLRYVFVTAYALSKTKHPNIHITKRMKLRVLRQIKFNLIDIQSVLNQLLLPRINFLKHS